MILSPKLQKQAPLSHSLLGGPTESEMLPVSMSSPQNRGTAGFIDSPPRFRDFLTYLPSRKRLIMVANCARVALLPGFR